MILAGKTAVITGGSEGIGFGIARAFASEGADVLLVGRSSEKLDEARKNLSHFGVRTECVSFDLTDSASIMDLSNEIQKRFADINILVNNAGIAVFTPFSDVGMQELDLHISLNIKAPYLLTQGLLSTLRKNRGSVINISSYFSRRMLPGRPSTAYSLTKGAIESFTKSLAFELGKDNIRVNAIAPGTVDTPLVRSNLGKLNEEGRQRLQEMIKTIYPLGRIGTPDDIGGIAVFLASDQAGWVTGAVFNIDGGLTTN
ncbi:MAG: SDR family oxidoreductase [Deferribacteres bacterium]|nr:SDR family oxidoreductase [Deferribacteres bacterium]